MKRDIRSPANHSEQGNYQRLLETSAQKVHCRIKARLHFIAASTCREQAIVQAHSFYKKSDTMDCV